MASVAHAPTAQDFFTPTSASERSSAGSAPREFARIQTSGLASRRTCPSPSESARRFAWIPPAASTGGLLLLLAVAYWALLRGIDFGTHWDEIVQARLLARTAATGIFLPENFYNYPSMIYWISILANFEKVVDPAYGAGGSIDWLSAFVFRTRPVFAFLSILGAVWLFVGAAAVRSPWRWAAAIMAASFYLGSWELHYHSRWIAPDALMAQFVALWLMALLYLERMPDSAALARLVGVAAGLAAGTKYNAAVLVPLSLVFVVLLDASWRMKLRRGVTIVLPAAAVFIATTPGIVLRFFTVISHVRKEAIHYKTTHGSYLGVFPYDVASPSEYAARLAEYLVLVLGGWHWALAAAVAIAAGLGAVELWRQGRRPLLVTLLLGIAALFAFYLTMHVFIVRNFLILAPFVTYLSAVGAAGLLERLMAQGRRRASAVLVAMFITFAGLTSGFHVWAARSIGAFSEDGLVERVSEEIRHRANSERIAVLGSLHAELTNANVMPDAVSAPAAADTLFIRHGDLSDHRLRYLPATRRNSFEWVGPYDVNFNYYPSWIGSDRVLVVKRDLALKMGLLPPPAAAGLHRQ